MWNAIAKGDKRVTGVNRKVLESLVNHEAHQAFAAQDNVTYDLLTGLFDVYTEEPIPFNAPLESATALSNDQMVLDIQTVLNAQQQAAAAQKLVLQPAIVEQDAGPPVIIRTPEGETPAINLQTGEQRSVYIQPPPHHDVEQLYANLHTNYHAVGAAATSGHMSSSSRDQPSYVTDYVPARYKGPREDPGVFFQPSRSSHEPSGEPRAGVHKMERPKMRKVQIEVPDGHGHIITTTKRVVVPSSHRDEDERYRNAQRAAASEVNHEAQILERKKIKYERKRQSLFG
jgi:hypothetical protein